MNVLRKMEKILILFVINNLLRGTHAFKAKRTLLNLCNGVDVKEGSKIVTPIHLPVMSTLCIGHDCWIGRDFSFEGNGEVVIGDRCDIAPQVTFLTGSHEIGSAERRAGEGYNGKIEVGDGTWIGSRAVILPNVYIEKGNVIGSSTTITKNTKENCVYAGNPGKVIRELD